MYPHRACRPALLGSGVASQVRCAAPRLALRRGQMQHGCAQAHQARDMWWELEEWRQARSAMKAAAANVKAQQHMSGRPMRAGKENVPSASELFSGKGPSCGASASPPATPAKLQQRRVHGSAEMTAKLEVPPLAKICQNSGRSAVAMARPSRQPRGPPPSPREDPVAIAGSAVVAAIACWEDWTQAEAPGRGAREPPSSPASPFAAVARRPRPADPLAALPPELRPRALAAALAVALAAEAVAPAELAAPQERADPPAAEAGPVQRRLLARLEEVELEETRPEEEDEVTPMRRRLQAHEVSWPQPTALDMEDHLSRAFDIVIFWFFEARDRASCALPEFQRSDEPLECIHEYPPDWPQWRINSFELREAARAARAGARQHGHIIPAHPDPGD